MTNEENTWSPEQESMLKKHIAQAEQIVEWIMAMPPIDKFGQSFVLGLLAGRSEGVAEHERGVSEEEIDKLVQWANGRLIELLTISGVIRAHVAVRWNDETNQPEFILTDTGKKARYDMQAAPDYEE